MRKILIAVLATLAVAGTTFSALTTPGPESSSAQAATPSVVAFGDSLTWGAGAGSSWSTGTSGPTGSGYEGDSYPKQLAALSGWSVTNEGIAGDLVTAGSVNDVQNGTDRFQDLVPTEPAGTTFVVMLGFNDAAAQKTPTAIVDGYKRMITDAHAADDTIFFATIPPGDWAVTDPREVIREAVNNWIRTVGAADGVIDAEAAVAGAGATSTPAQYRANGKTANPNSAIPHLTPAGYALIAQAVYNGVTSPVKTLPAASY